MAILADSKKNDPWEGWQQTSSNVWVRLVGILSLCLYKSRSCYYWTIYRKGTEVGSGVSKEQSAAKRLAEQMAKEIGG